jgi:hypothetical protein
MHELLQFVGDHPLLTVTLALIIGQTIIFSLNEIFGEKDDDEED